MTQEHKDFLELHINNRETIAAGFARRLDKDILNMYEKIYQSYIDSNYILTKWCSTCVFDCMKRVYEYYDVFIAENTNEINVSHETSGFIFPDDLDKIEPTGEQNLLDNKGKRKGRPRLNG